MHNKAIYVIDHQKIFFFYLFDGHNLIDKMLSSWLSPLLLPILTQGNNWGVFYIVFANEMAITEASIVKNFAQGYLIKVFVPFCFFGE